MCPQQRRDLLALAGATATSLAAGCLSTGHGEFNFSATTDDRTTETDAAAGSGGATATVDGEFAARTWLPAPDVLEAESLFVFAGDLDAPRDAGVDDQALRRTYSTMLPLPDDAVARDTVTEFASLQGYATACRFDALTTAVRDEIATIAGDAGPTATAGAGTSAGTTTDGERTDDVETAEPIGEAPDGYEDYATEAGVFWLGADHLLFGRRRRLVEAMHAARVGDADRYASNPDLEEVLDAAGDVDLVGATTSSQQVVSSSVAYAYGWRFDDGVDLVAPFAFDDADAADAEAVASLGEWAGFAEYERTDVTTDGRVVTFTGELPVSEFDLLERDDGGETPGGGDRTPQVAFEFEVDRGEDGAWNGDEEERVVLTHTGGDTIDLDAVVVEYDGTAVGEHDGIASTEPEGETWVAGGQWTLRATDGRTVFESGATVRVVWTNDDGDQSAVLAEATLP
jgi:hypothetical protein